MRPVVFTKSLAPASANNVALSQYGLAAVPLLLNGLAVITLPITSTGIIQTVAQLDTQRRIVIASTGNDNGITFTVLGTNDNGAPIKSVVQGTNIGIVATPIDFYTVTSITPSGNTAAVVQVGTNTVGSTPWARFDPHMQHTTLSLAAEVIAPVTYTVEYTYDEFLIPIPPGFSPTSKIADGPPTPVPLPLPLPGLTLMSITDDTATPPVPNVAPLFNTPEFPMLGWRLTINAGTGTVQLTGIQAGIGP